MFDSTVYVDLGDAWREIGYEPMILNRDFSSILLPVEDLDLQIWFIIFTQWVWDMVDDALFNVISHCLVCLLWERNGVVPPSITTLVISVIFYSWVTYFKRLFVSPLGLIYVQHIQLLHFLRHIYMMHNKSYLCLHCSWHKPLLPCFNFQATWVRYPRKVATVQYRYLLFNFG